MKATGKIGFSETAEVRPGVWQEIITERRARFEVSRLARRYDTGGHVNDELVASHEFSLIHDTYVMEHFSRIRYVTWEGTRWKVTYAEVAFPRIHLTIGGVYNGPTP